MSTAVDETVETPTPTPDETPAPDETPDETPDEMTPDGEPGPGDDEVPPEPEPPAPAEPPAPPISEREIEAKMKKCEKASERYLAAVQSALGEDLSDFVPTPLSLPWLFGFVMHPRMQALPEEVVTATKALIGEPIPPPLVAAPDAHECPVCHGWGAVLTGSKVHGKNTATCRECKGRGWVGERANVTPEQVAAGITPESIDAEHEPAVLLSEDNWGTPLGHPDYGKMPQYRETGWAEALEAYKRGEAAPVA